MTTSSTCSARPQPLFRPRARPSTLRWAPLLSLLCLVGFLGAAAGAQDISTDVPSGKYEIVQAELVGGHQTPGGLEGQLLLRLSSLSPVEVEPYIELVQRDLGGATLTSNSFALGAPLLPGEERLGLHAVMLDDLASSDQLLLTGWLGDEVELGCEGFCDRCSETADSACDGDIAEYSCQCSGNNQRQCNYRCKRIR